MMQRCSHEGRSVVSQRSGDEDAAEEMQLSHEEDKAVVVQ